MIVILVADRPIKKKIILLAIVLSVLQFTDFDYTNLFSETTMPTGTTYGCHWQFLFLLD
jgi:hypothetical protein